MSTQKKVYVGLVGEMGSGKGTVSDILRDLVGGDCVEFVRSSEILEKILQVIGNTPDLDKCNRLFLALETQFPEFLTSAVLQRMDSSPYPIVVFDGVRMLSDKLMILGLGGKILYITTSIETRLERIRRRNQRSGDADMTLEQLRIKELDVTRRYIPIIGNQANFSIDNDGDLEDFREKVLIFANLHLKQFLLSSV